MRISICDDEPTFLEKISKDIQKILKEFEFNISVDMYYSGKELLEAYAQNPEIDILFIDILLGNENGYQIASEIRKINQKIKIIFLTSITKYVLKGYEIGASRYLLKPVTFSKLRTVLLSTIKEVKNSKCEYIVEKNDDGIHKIYLDDILYIDTYGRNTIIHASDYKIVSYNTLKYHMQKLNDLFVRCHASTIINLAYVVELKKDCIRMQGGDIVPLSKSRKNEVKTALISYFKTML